jgi:dsRNA-specific ribonuclease
MRNFIEDHEKQDHSSITNEELENVNTNLKRLLKSQTPKWVNYATLAITFITLVVAIFLRA